MTTARPARTRCVLTVPGDAAVWLSAQALEQGADDSEFEGQLGDGRGKWQLIVSAGRPLVVMSLLLGQSGNLANLSTVTADRTIRGGSGPDRLYGGKGDDVFNPGDRSGTGDGSEDYDAIFGSAGNDTIIYSDTSVYAYQELNYAEFDESGITVTIDGAANRATVDKGAAGADTIVDVANPLHAGGSPPYAGGFSLQGTDFDDVFDVSLVDGQWLAIEGEGGNDTFNIGTDGTFSVAYWYAPNGVSVDLEAGTASDDGHGDVDTINGHPWGVFGSEFTDVLRGSDRDEYFYGGGGSDTIDGGGGTDRLRFSITKSVRSLNVDLEAGTATGTWDGIPFSYTLTSIENVFGGSGDDVLLGTDGNDVLGGGDGNDILNPRDNDGDDFILGSAGNDRIIYSSSTGERAYQHLAYLWGYDRYDYDHGLTVTIDVAANQATVDKGPNGTDTIVDIDNPMMRWGFGIEGTSANDVFNLNMNANDYHWMSASGGPGNDTFNIQENEYGTVRVVYTYPRTRNGIDVDLSAGRVNDDGFGDIDTINGNVSELQGTDLSDVIRGSDNDETFIGRRGDDDIDGGGGWDTLRFDAGPTSSVVVDLEEGTATGTWGESASYETDFFLGPSVEKVIDSSFSYRIANIEHVRGGHGDSELYGSADDERLRGRNGDDVLEGGGGDDRLDGGDGDDIFVFGAGHGEDSISDFTDGEDTIILVGLGVSKSQVLSAAFDDGGGGTWIDLRQYGGGTISLWHFPVEDLDESDFLL